MNEVIGLQDYILAPLLFIFFAIAGFYYAKYKYGNTPLMRYFVLGLILKMIGSAMVGAVFILYYQKGDTLYYYLHSKTLTFVFANDPVHNWIVFFPEFFHDSIINTPYFPADYLRKANSYMLVRIAGLLNLFLFDSYFSIAICFSVFSFIGSWKLYKVFYYYAPELHKQIATSTLFLPCLIMWGSGLFKDTLTFGALGILTYSLHSIAVRKHFKAAYIFYILISLYLIGVVKPYILMALLPSMVFFQVNSFSARISSSFVKTTVFPLLILLVIIGSLGILSILNTTFTAYNLDNMEDKLEGFQRWHSIRSEQTDGSGYTLGSGGTSPGELLVKFPLAVNVTLFRPYIWEARKPIVILAALESLFVLFVTIQTFRRVGIKGTIKAFFNDPFISFCIVFSFIFAFSIGISSYNFGALVRFKIPCMPFYMMGLYLSQRKLSINYSR